jgi:hypothetical protein
MPTYEELKSELKEIAKLIAEFPDSIRPQVYELLIGQFAGSPAITKEIKDDSPEVGTLPSQENFAKGKKEKSVTSRKGGVKESYSVDRELNLRGDKNIPSFRNFHSEKQPRSAQEFNAVAVYYLKKVLELETATLNHAYTCYKEVGRRQPEAFKQSFTDTKNRNGWVEFDLNGNLLIPHRGVVFVENDLPHVKTASE